jgi:hypothetical protein
MFANLLVITGLSLAALNRTARLTSRPQMTPTKTPSFFTDLPPPITPITINPIEVPTRPNLQGTTSYAKLRKGPDQQQWDAAFADEMRRLLNRTNSIKWLPHGKVPAGRKASYANPVGRIKVTNGKRVFRVRLSYGGNQSDYDGPRTSHTVDYSTVKCFLNTIVTENADHITLDIDDFYLHTVLDESEYMWMPVSIIPSDLRTELGIDHLPDSASILLEVLKGLYGMP